MLSRTNRGHERVEYAHGEGRTAGERLGQVQLGVRVIVVILVQELAERSRADNGQIWGTRVRYGKTVVRYGGPGSDMGRQWSDMGDQGQIWEDSGQICGDLGKI